MSTRARRFAVALVLLAAAWPAFGQLLATVVNAASTWVSAHPSVVVAVIAAVLLLGTVPGPVDRALTRLSNRPARSTR